MDIDIIRKHFNDVLADKLINIAPADDYLVLIGGSVSYGFADNLSDADIYIVWDVPGQIWLPELRPYLFTHQKFDDIKIQYIPLNLQDKRYKPLQGLLNGNFDSLKNASINLLYDVLHFIPVHDTSDRIGLANNFIKNLEPEFWKDKLIDHCCRHIDILEAFYSTVKRNNPISGYMLYGGALKGLLEIVYLANEKPYPTVKWIWDDLQNVDENLYTEIQNILANGSSESCRGMESIIRGVSEIVTKSLETKKIVPDYILDDLRNP